MYLPHFLQASSDVDQEIILIQVYTGKL